MAVPSTPETVTGRVASVNPKGIRLEGQDGWLNFSRYAQDIVPPMRGQTVTVTLDRQGYVRAVDAARSAQEPATGRQAPVGQHETVITRRRS